MLQKLRCRICLKFRHARALSCQNLLRRISFLQKKNLIHYFEKAKLQNVLDDAIDFLLRKSEAIIFVGWKTKEKQIRRKVDVNMAKRAFNTLFNRIIDDFYINRG